MFPSALLSDIRVLGQMSEILDHIFTTVVRFNVQIQFLAIAKRMLRPQDLVCMFSVSWKRVQDGSHFA